MSDKNNYKFYIGDRLLPVTPGKIEIKYGDKLKRVDTAAGMEIVFPETTKLTEIRFSALLPNVKYPFAVYPNGFVRGGTLLQELLLLKESGKPFRFRVLRKADGVSLLSTDMNMIFSEIVSREDAGDGRDITVDLRLVEYRDFSVRNVAFISSASAAVDVHVRPADTAPVHTDYTVVKGDSLWMISHRFLGNGNRWKEIYNLNKNVIDARNKGTGNPYYTIYPSQVFQLP